jgi:hypothetical protein
LTAVSGVKPVPQCLCTVEAANSGKVCGVDGATYASLCTASCAGVEVDATGQKCKVIEQYACPALWAPVCGDDGNTYSNECNLGLANGVSKKHDGECEAKPVEPVKPVVEPVKPVQCCRPGTTCCAGRCVTTSLAESTAFKARCTGTSPAVCCSSTY